MKTNGSMGSKPWGPKIKVGCHGHDHMVGGLTTYTISAYYH